MKAVKSLNFAFFFRHQCDPEWLACGPHIEKLDPLQCTCSCSVFQEGVLWKRTRSEQGTHIAITIPSCGFHTRGKFCTVDQNGGTTGGLGGAHGYFCGIGCPLPFPECAPHCKSLCRRIFDKIAGIPQRLGEKKNKKDVEWLSWQHTLQFFMFWMHVLVPWTCPVGTCLCATRPKDSQILDPSAAFCHVCLGGPVPLTSFLSPVGQRVLLGLCALCRQ